MTEAGQKDKRLIVNRCSEGTDRIYRSWAMQDDAGKLQMWTGTMKEAEGALKALMGRDEYIGPASIESFAIPKGKDGWLQFLNRYAESDNG